MVDLDGKKILFVITKSNWGGAQQYAYTLATHFKNQGADAVVALGGTGRADAPSGLLESRLKEAGVRTIFLKTLTRDVGPRRELSAFAELLRIVRNEKPDVLHVNSSKAGGLGALVGRIAGVRHIIYTAHGFAHREPRPLYSRMLIWLASWITIVLSHRVIVVSESDLKYAPVFFSKKKLVVVHNGIAPFFLLPREDARTSLAHIAGALPLTGLWILMNGELHHNKGADVAINAFSGIAAKHTNAYLVITGDGEERAVLETLIEKHNLKGRVFLLGFVANSRTYLNAADIFLLPSRKEGLPYAVLEAGFACLPVIASRVGGVPEIIKDGVTGLLTQPDDSVELSKQLERVLADTALRTGLGKALQEKVMSEYTDEKMLDGTVSAYGL